MKNDTSIQLFIEFGPAVYWGAYIHVPEEDYAPAPQKREVIAESYEPLHIMNKIEPP